MNDFWAFYCFGEHAKACDRRKNVRYPQPEPQIHGIVAFDFYALNRVVLGCLDTTCYNFRLKIFVYQPFALLVHYFFYSAYMRQKRVRYDAKPVLTHGAPTGKFLNQQPIISLW